MATRPDPTQDKLPDAPPGGWDDWERRIEGFIWGLLMGTTGNIPKGSGRPSLPPQPWYKVFEDLPPYNPRPELPFGPLTPARTAYDFPDIVPLDVTSGISGGFLMPSGSVVFKEPWGSVLADILARSRGLPGNTRPHPNTGDVLQEFVDMLVRNPNHPTMRN